MKRLFTLLSFLSIVLSTSLHAQQVINHKFDLTWSEDNPLSFPMPVIQGHPDCSHTFRIPLTTYAAITTEIYVESEDIVPVGDPELYTSLPSEYNVGSLIEQERGKWYARIWIMPIHSLTDQKASRILSGVLTV